jgi:magnesium transporter
MKALTREHRSTVLIDSIRRLHRRGATSHLLNLLKRVHPADLTPLFNYLTESESCGILKLLIDNDLARAADVVTTLHSSDAAERLALLEVKEISLLLQLCQSDDAAEIVAEMPEELREAVLSQMREEEGDEVQDLLSYPEETAGRIMSPDFFALPEDTSARDAIRALRSQHDVEMVFYLYVVDSREHLLGVVSLRQLILTNPDLPLREVMSTNVVTVRTEDDQEEVARLVSRYDFLAIPVVDEHNRLMGIVTVDDVIDVLREEATEDFYKLAGTSDEERLQRSALSAARHRLPWLTVSLLGGAVAAGLFVLYDDALSSPVNLFSRFMILVGFLPMLLGMGGNIGTQSATIVVRGLATGRVERRQVWSVLLREIRIAGILGLGYGALLWAASLAVPGLPAITGFVIGASICTIMILAAGLGSFLPMLLARISLDPAIATGPLLTALVDIVGILVYFQMVMTFLLR